VGAQLFLDVLRDGSAHLLNGPTSDVWIGPWRRHLEALGVTFRFGTVLERLIVRDRRSAVPVFPKLPCPCARQWSSFTPPPCCTTT
jgi:hypothetical protein